MTIYLIVRIKYLLRGVSVNPDMVKQQNMCKFCDFTTQFLAYNSKTKGLGTSIRLH